MNGRTRTRTIRWRIGATGVLASALLIAASAGVGTPAGPIDSSSKARLVVAAVPEYGSILLLGAGLLIASHSLRLRRRGRTDMTR